MAQSQLVPLTYMNEILRESLRQALAEELPRHLRSSAQFIYSRDAIGNLWECESVLTFGGQGSLVS